MGGPHKTPRSESSGPQNKRSMSAATWSVCIFLLLLTSPLAKSDLNPFYSWTDFSLWAIILFTEKWAEGENKAKQRHPQDERIQRKCLFGFAVLYNSKLNFLIIYIINIYRLQRFWPFFGRGFLRSVATGSCTSYTKKKCNILIIFCVLQWILAHFYIYIYILIYFFLFNSSFYMNSLSVYFI